MNTYIIRFAAVPCGPALYPPRLIEAASKEEARAEMARQRPGVNISSVRKYFGGWVTPSGEPWTAAKAQGATEGER